jgi:hypothetical protein
VKAQIVPSWTLRELGGGIQQCHGLLVQALLPILYLLQGRRGVPVAVDARDRQCDAWQREVAASQQIDKPRIVNVSWRVLAVPSVVPTKS